MLHITSTDSTTLAPVTLRSGEQLTYGLYPNPNFHRGRPAGTVGTATLAGRRNAVRTHDGTVWVEVVGKHGPNGDWIKPCIPVAFAEGGQA